MTQSLQSTLENLKQKTAMIEICVRLEQDFTPMDVSCEYRSLTGLHMDWHIPSAYLDELCRRSFLTLTGFTTGRMTIYQVNKA